MILDADTLDPSHFSGRTYDACVVGSGPAGVTIARRLAARGRSVALLEAGALEYDPRSQDVYAGESTGQPYYPLDACRLRFLGGTSNHWGGWTKALDAHDFEPRAHHPLSGWPIRKPDIDAYAAEADEILNLPSPIDPPDILPGQGEFVPGLFRFSRPVVKFGEKYRTDLESATGPDVCINANLVDLQFDESGRQVSEAVFSTYAGARHRVRATTFVLCLGGIENARALLNMNGRHPRGIGNENDLVGRCFMEHPHAPVGRAILRTAPTWMLSYAPSASMMWSMQILNFGLRIGYFDQWNAPEFTGAFSPQGPCAAGFDAALAAAMQGADQPCPGLAVDVFVSCEQQLGADNRVRLTDERDAFGWRRIALDWTLSDMDVRTLRMAAQRAAELLAIHDAGRMQLAGWVRDGGRPAPDQVWGGNHHMGTTRMSADPKTGVVDAQCRVHSVENLYVGGSSVFATSGHANPTYTIVQLALRLSDHLDAQLGR